MATFKDLAELMAHDEVGVACAIGTATLRRPAVDMLQPLSSKLILYLLEREEYLSRDIERCIKQPENCSGDCYQPAARMAVYQFPKAAIAVGPK